MSRSALRRLFIGVFIFLVIQYGIVGIVGVYASEPWPALVFPAFKGVYDQSGVIESYTHSLEVELADGERASFSRDKFMTFMPIIHRSVFLDKQCMPADLSSTERTEVCRQPEGARLFLDRARQLFPDRTVRHVDVVWKRIRFDMQSRASTVAPADTLRLHP